MKTAEEWYKQNEDSGNEDADGNQLPYDYTIADIREIQLDAMREGMRRAAAKETTNIVTHKDCACEYCAGIYNARQAILTAAEQLTEKDLQ